ncbi:unnamed protein product [Caenorhabditis auriculariae]|uniref:Cadherin domain-containing protein n=1 Tax=Caenorhabditis auriculariae TaxID=2777116 RepID=A0A8S1GWD5_9PELO|nr:unnamed protein product [Caenorhabditis auriculariae]
MNIDNGLFSESDVYVAMSERRGVVHRVVATDKDSGMNGRVRFELAEKHSSFSVDEKTGELSIGQASVFPQNITIRAYDYGSPPMSSQQILNIRVLNESRQRWHHFDEEEYVIDVDINTREDAVVYSFDGTLPLRLVPESSVFRLRGANIVVCSSALQPQEHRFTIVAESDRGVVDWAPVFVRVLRPAAPPPRISSTSCGTVSVEEGRSVNSVKRVFAVDAAKNATYRIQGVKPDFSINSANGVISMNALDRENLQEHLLVVIVEDGGKNDSCTVRVVVTDINDNEPQFAVETPQELLINSSRKVDDVIFRFRASDMDIGSNGKITFELIEDQSNALDLIPETGDLVLRRYGQHNDVVCSSVLSFPAAGSKEWMIRVRVADQGSPPMASERFIRMKNDLAAEETLPKPAFLRQSYISSVDEGLPRGQLVAKVATNFGDSPVTYSIVEGNLDSAFSVGLDGVIRTAQELDREIVERYHLKLIGTGQWAGQIETQVVVRVNNVNDNPPSFPAPRQKKVSEALPVGSYVFTVVANDVDGLRPLEYSLTNKRDLFHIDRFTGVVHLQSPLDYELEKEHVIRVNVTDGLFSATTTTTVVVLDANDNAPVFAKTFYDIQTEPLISLDTPIARIQAHDVDDGQNAQLVYFLADDEKRFKIAPDNGTLYFTHFPARNSTFLITAVAKDRGSPPLTSSVAVRVTVENATKQKRPVFSKPEYEFDVPENVTVSTVIGNISNEFDFLTYRVVDVEASKFFFVDRLGRVSVQQNLDRESRDSFTFLVEVDSETATEGRGASTARVVVRIKDVNDNSPVFGVAPIVFLRDGLQRGDVIAQLSASDEDFGENGRVSYRIFAGNDYGVVSLNSESGALLFNEWNDGQLFDYPDGSWSLLVEAHDHGKPSRWSTLTIPVTLKLTSWSGTAPFFVLPSYDSHVLEDTPLNSVIAHVKASNRYGLPNRNLIYSIKDNTDEKFGIDSSTGEMRLKSSLDWESASFYSMFVSVSDSHGRSAVVPLKIFVEPVDEYAPVFISNAYRFKVPITREIGDAIGEVQAVDEDGGKHGIVSYRIADLQSTVSIDPVTGVLSLRKSLGKRKNTTLEQITVVAMSPAKQSTTTVLFEFGQFANTSQLLSFFQLKYVQIFCLATVLLLFCLLIVMISCMACKNRDAENVPKKESLEIYSVEKRKLSDHPKPAIFNARAAGKACSMTSSSSMNSSAIRRVDLVSTRSHVDSGIDPDTVSVNSSVTDYLVSIGVNPNPIPARLKTNTTYDSLNNSILNEYIYARVDDVIPPGPINLSRTLDMMDPPRSTYSTQRPHAVPSFQPLTEIFSEIAEMQREERQRQYVQVEI